MKAAIGISRAPCVLLACVVAWASHPVAASAQAVDYGTLEQIFGEPITMSATGKPQRASDVPADMVIITHDDIRRSGATDIPTILQFVTGIDVRRYSFGDTEVGIRGYDTVFNPRLLVLVDGRQVYLDDYGYVAWNDIPVQLDEIRQIEVVKGPASALFGFNAASGVINIVTYDPLLDHVNTATVRGGTQGYGAGDSVATVQAGTTAGVRVSVGGWTATGFEDRAGTAEAVSPRYASFNISAHWQVAAAILLRFEGGMTDSHTERALPTEIISATQDQLNFWRAGATAASPAGTLDADIYRNQGLLNFGGTRGPIDNKVLVGRLNDLFKLGAANAVRVGVEYRTNSAANQAAFGGKESYQDWALDGMWDWLISSAYELTNAVRVDRLRWHDAGDLSSTPGRTFAARDSAQITQPSFNSGLVIKVGDADTVRLTAGRGLQLPSLINLGLQIDVRGLHLAGSPSVVPAVVWNAEIALDHALTSIGATLTTGIFFQRDTDLIEPAGNTPPAIIDNLMVSQAENIGSSNEIGVEAGLRGKTAGGLRWNASYRYASISQNITAAAAADPGPSADYARGTPLHELVAGVGTTQGKWEMDVQGRWQSSYVDYRFVSPGVHAPFKVGNYVTFNARVGYQVTDYLTVAATAEQFNLSRILETSGNYVNRQCIASATLKY